MKISPQEQRAIQQVVNRGRVFGFGNMISHLQSAWAADLVAVEGFNEKSARAAAGGGYPIQMHLDLIERGEWDETGARYAKSRKR